MSCTSEPLEELIFALGEHVQPCVFVIFMARYAFGVCVYLGPKEVYSMVAHVLGKWKF